jgi:Domain of unknown function (DUF4234)
MAEKIAIPGSGGTAKIRHPWGVFFLALITLGIYYLYWYYQANRELRDYGVGESPFRSLLALFPGGLIISRRLCRGGDSLAGSAKRRSGRVWRTRPTNGWASSCI